MSAISSMSLHIEMVLRMLLLWKNNIITVLLLFTFLAFRRDAMYLARLVRLPHAHQT